jgi:hypothetical protein
MSDSLLLTRDHSRVLVYSQRNLCKHPAWACLYELQDLVSEVDETDFFMPTQDYEYSKWIFKWGKRFSRSAAIGDQIRPKPNSLVLDRDYDLFYVLLAEPFEVLALNSINNWRDRCKFVVCHLVEIWEKDIPAWESILRYFFKDFDHIFVGHHHGLDKIRQITGRPCSYLPITVDALEFCPNLQVQERPIDVMSLGRKSEITHQALLNFARNENRWYVYDTLKILNMNTYVKSHKEHRSLIINQLKRTKYFLANRARADRPDIRGSQAEIGYRFFEGAAAGTVMIGEYPETKIYEEYFNWPEATIRSPFDNPDIGALIKELDAQPERTERIRRDNVVNSLMRYDHVYSWEKALGLAGLPATEKLLKRKADLAEKAEAIKTQKLLTI